MEPNYRRCISCRQVAHRSNFWRVVRTHPARRVQLDSGEGRSAYVCPCKACLQAAQRKNRLGKVLRTSVPDDVYAALWTRLESDPRAGSTDSVDGGVVEGQT